MRNIDAYTFSYDIDGISFTPVEHNALMDFCDIAHSDEFSEHYTMPSFSELRDLLEPLRNKKVF